MISILTHQRAEGDDSEESLDQDAEPVRQSSVVAAVRIRLTNVRHVRHFKRDIIQESLHQHDPAVPVHVHADTLKNKPAQPSETKGAPPREKGLTLFSYSMRTNDRIC